MRINNNIMAMNTHRQLGINTDAGAKSVEKLSSGYRINRAGDDAAGLAISEKMRGQIRGLDQASRNSQDAISLVQTAEGALNETHDILQRMRELSVQSATDTNVSEDRTSIQNEMTQLTAEITRISDTTEFNTQSLLDGTFTDKVFHIGSNADQNVTLSVAGMDANDLSVSTYVAATTTTVAGLDVSIDTGITAAVSVAIATNSSAVNTATIAVSTANVVTITVASDSSGVVTSTNADVLALISGSTAAAALIDASAGTATALAAVNTAVVITGAAATGIDIATQSGANLAITTLDAAINTVSSERAKLGAVQNRLEHTIKNLDTSAENLQASESRIRDVDMAKEMMEFTKNNILQQAAQSMLAQANQAPEGVLQLLR